MDSQYSHHFELPVADPGALADRPALRSPDVTLLSAVVDQIGMGVALATFEGIVLHRNPAACNLMSDCGLEIGDDTRFVARRPADATALQRALSFASRGRKSVTVLGDSERRSTTIAVQPLDLPPNSARGGCAMILFTAGARANGSAVAAYSDAHSLTPAESAVVAGLCDGLQAKEVAQRTRSSIATVRSHLRSIYYKTGARNLQDLLARVASLPPLGFHGG